MTQLLVLLCVDIIFLLGFLDVFAEKNGSLNSHMFLSMILFFLWYSYLCFVGVYTRQEHWLMTGNFLGLLSVCLWIFHFTKGMKARGDLSPWKYTKNLANCSILLAAIIYLIKLCYLISRHQGWNKYLIYFLNKPVTHFGWIIQSASTVLLLIISWKQIKEFWQTNAADRKVKRRKSMILFTAAILMIVVASIGYDAEVLKYQDLVNRPFQRYIVGLMYSAFFVCLFIGHFVARSVSEKSLLMIASMNLMAFWATNLARILISLLSIPFIVLVTRRADRDKVLQSPVFVTMVTIFIAGFFNSTGEQYLFEVSQRAIKRYPVQAFDVLMSVTGTHVFFIKFCSCLFVQSILSVCKNQWSLFHEFLLFTMNGLLFLPYAYTMTTTDRLRKGLFTFMIGNILVNSYGLFVKLAALLFNWIIMVISKIFKRKKHAQSEKADTEAKKGQIESSEAVETDNKSRDEDGSSNN